MEEVDLWQVVFESVAPRMVAFVIILGLVFVLLRARPSSAAARARTERPIPDWYPDPWGEPCQRWWNGVAWTPAVRPYPWPGPPPTGGPPPGTGYPPI